MSLTIFGGYVHTCVSKSRFITFKVKEDVRALLGGTCTYKQESSLKPIADRVFYLTTMSHQEEGKFVGSLD